MTNKIVGVSATILAVLGVMAVVAALSWGVAAFITWLLSMCFGFVWTARVSTGVWIIVLTVSALVAIRND